jgi:hypothetical protein
MGKSGSLGSTVARTRDRVHRSLAKCNMELAMGEVGSSAHPFLQKTGRIIFKINGAETAFTLASLAFCAIHWLVERSFSIRLVLSALLLGAIAATLAAWLSDSVLSLIRATMKPPQRQPSGRLRRR